MKRILISAYAVAPDRGSEPGMGWNWCTGVARDNEVFVITEGEFRGSIEKQLAILPQRNHLHFFYLPVSPEVRRMCWNQGDWRFYLYYRKWQKRALETARAICRDYPIDIIHQLNMIGFREPGYLWKISGPRVVWGPVGGMGTVRLSCFADLPFSLQIKFRLKNLITRIQYHSYRVRQMTRRSDAVIVATEAEKDVFRRIYGRESILVSETGTVGETSVVQHGGHLWDRTRFHLLWVGRFIPTKQLSLALQTLAHLDDRFVLHVVGTGNRCEVAAAKAKADSLDLSDRVVWHGQVAHDRVQEYMHAADLFFFTSILEATSTVILEAVSNHLPIVCFDACGFGPIVDASIGRKIPLSRRVWRLSPGRSRNWPIGRKIFVLCLPAVHKKRKPFPGREKCAF